MTERRILSIDDDEDINNYLKVVLKKNDFTIETACEIEDFFKKVVAFKPHLCLVDLNLGAYEGFGYKIVEMMRTKIGPEIVIIVMSRRNSPEDINHALESGANDYIQKPIDEKMLIHKLNIFMDRYSEESEFPYYAIPSKDTDCFFKLPMKIHAINEEYITIHCHDYLAKGSMLTLENDFLKNIPFYVKDTKIDTERGGYLIRVDLDEHDHAHLMPTIRMIMLKTPPLPMDE